MQNNKTTNNKNNKTVNLSRAIMMLVKNADKGIEKTLLAKIEAASYDLIDVTHNNETKINSQLSYIHDLMIMARQVNLFLEENTIFIIGVISEISKSYETKLEDKNEEVINEKIRDILQGGEMSETDNVMAKNSNTLKDREVKNLYISNRQEEIKNEIKSLEKTSETKSDFYTTEKIKDIKSIEIKSEIKKDMRSVEGNRKLSRKEEVVKAMSHTPVSIKEISQKVLGCSEKTIQRELNNLVDERVINRIGEKRWSKYVLA